MLLPRKYQQLLAQGSQALSQGDFRQAERHLSNVVRAHPSHMEANFYLGTLYAQTAQFPAAAKYLARALQQQPKSVQILNNLANVHRLQDQLDDAEAYYRKALAIDPHFAPALINLAFIHFRRQQWQQALDYFERIDAANANDAALVFALADTHGQLGHHEQAITLYRRVIELDPSDQQGAAIRLAELGAGAVPDQHPHNLTLDVYRSKASQWDQDVQRSDHRYYGPELIEQLTAPLRLATSGLRILDLGCGTGLCGSYLRQTANNLVGVDLSPDMLAVAKEKGLYDELVEADLQQYLDHCKEDFNLITAAGVFILFGDLSKPLREIARLLSPGGYCAFTCYRSDDGDITVRHNRHFAHSRDYLTRCAAEVGLEVAQIDEVIHETEKGVGQPGYAVLLRRPADSI